MLIQNESNQRIVLIAESNVAAFIFNHITSVFFSCILQVLHRILGVIPPPSYLEEQWSGLSVFLMLSDTYKKGWWLRLKH